MTTVIDDIENPNFLEEVDNAEEFIRYNYDDTITFTLRSSFEGSVELTIPRDQEFELKTLLQMLHNRNRFIVAHSDAIKRELEKSDDNK